MPRPLEIEILVLQEISTTILHRPDAESLLNDILEILNKRMGMIRGTFTLLHGDIFRIEASHGLVNTEKELGKYHYGEGITGRVGATGKPEIVPDIDADPRFLNRTQSRQHSTDNEKIAFICVPVIHNEQVVGTLSIDRLVNENTDLNRDLSLLQIISNITADAVAVLHEQHEERQRLLKGNLELRKMLTENPGDMIGNSHHMKNVYKLIRQVAPSDATVLIRGSSGTGKELVARAILNLSQRKDKPFITVNCAALPENLIESELFGHEKGAFTGAVTRRIGRAEEANGGTLFLDEIGDLPLQTQVKFLRFLQEKTFSRVGSNREIKSDVRFLAATSRNLEELMAKKLFREDLYYRLNIFPVMVPDLSKRRSDIILLSEHFIQKANLRYDKHIKRLSTPAINMLMSYHWPGNVRELENCIERAVLTAVDDTIYGYNLPPSLQTGAELESELQPNAQASFSTLVHSYQRELIVSALKRHNGNMSAAGRELQLSPRVMHYKVHLLGITPEWYNTDSAKN